MSQLPLPLRLADHAVFASFHGDGNEALVATLEELAEGGGGPGCWLWGAAATGKTHLLQAVCERAGDRSIYLPMRMLSSMGSDVLDGLASRQIVCIDDVEAVLGVADWEHALFALVNELSDRDAQLIIASNRSPRASDVVLPDLGSRFSRLATFAVNRLSDPQSVKALQLRSRHRGLDLPDDVAEFLIKRSRRDMASLYELLDQLDAAALQAKRRLTVPFVRQVLEP